jgi:hypothetical protein
MLFSNSDSFPFSGAILRTLRPSEIGSSVAKATPKHSFLHKPKTSGRMLFLVVFLLSALYAAKDLKRGWVPSDEGTFGQSAERVLQGELPHKDFDEGYTGGLTYLHALAFRVLGTNVVNFRYVLYLFFLAWVPAIYYIASRFISPTVASAVTFLAVAWSIPNYSAPVPSWYNLFFATFGIAAIFGYVEKGSRRYLFIAGLCGGLSFLFKVTGLYFIAGVLFFFVFREQVAPANRSSRTIETVLYRIFVAVSLFLYEALLILLLRREHTSKVSLYFLLPGLAIGATILLNEFVLVKSRSARFAFLFRDILPFAAGAAVPVLLFLIPNFLTGTLVRFVQDVFIFPNRRFIYASLRPPGGNTILAIIANLLLIAAVCFAGKRLGTVLGVLTLIGTPLILLIAREKNGIYMATWHTIWVLVPVVLVLGLLWVPLLSMSSNMDAVRQQQLFLVLSVAATCSLIQFPFVAPIYLCYVAPLVILAVTALISHLEHPPRLLVAALFCVYLLYAMLEVTPGFIYAMGWYYSPDQQKVDLTLPRAAGLRVTPETARTYEELGVLLKEHAQGKYIYATPDCPEVYFLYGFRNPTHTFFDFNEDPIGRTRRVLATITEHDIRVVVLNREPQFSGPVSTDLRSALEREFPDHATAGGFEVRWKP